MPKQTELYYLAVGGALASLAVVAGIWALFDAAGHSKYVCGTDTDDTVTNARIMDIGHFVTAFLTLCLPLYRARWLERDSGSKDEPKPQLANLAAVVAFLSFLLLIISIVEHGSVCSENKCITSVAASNADSGDYGLFNAQVGKMVGLSDTAGNAFLCNHHLTPAYFRIAQDYCALNLGDLQCTTPMTDMGAAERCLVYACSDLVEGRLERYIFSLVSIMMQIAGAYLMVLYERTRMANYTPSTAPQAALVPKELAAADDSTDDSSALLRQTRASVLLAHTSASGLRKRNETFYNTESGDINF